MVSVIPAGDVDLTILCISLDCGLDDASPEYQNSTARQISTILCTFLRIHPELVCAKETIAAWPAKFILTMPSFSCKKLIDLWSDPHENKQLQARFLERFPSLGNGLKLIVDITDKLGHHSWPFPYDRVNSGGSEL